MDSDTYGHSAYYTYIDSALKARWEPFIELEHEMLNFMPRPINDFASERKQEIERLRNLNPDVPVEELEELVDQQLEDIASPDWQFYKKFDERHMNEFVSVTILSQALCEALINAALAIGLAKNNSTELFSIMERGDLKTKWLKAPKSFFPAYDFPTGVGIHETLNILIQDRNALMHHKIDLEVNGKRVLKGSKFERNEYKYELSKIRRYFSLPYDLAELIRNLEMKDKILLLFDRFPIEVAKEHRI